MFKVDIIAIGRLKKGAFYDLAQEYIPRIAWDLSIIELESKYTDPKKAQEQEAQLIMEKLKPNAFIVIMDERGNGLRSLDFANTVQNLQNSGENHIQFVIGGADGLTDTVRGRANLLLSFGQQTWPHMLARVMLLEQIYRCQQILAGHPYHRE